MTIRLSNRGYIVLSTGELRRLPRDLVLEMFRDPEAHPIADLAGMRVNFADIVVELRAKKPTRVVREYFGYLSFDSRGVFDADRYGRAEMAKADVRYGPRAEQSDGSLVDAESKFIMRGGIWTPPREVATLIYEAALGKHSVPFIRPGIRHGRGS